MTTVPKGLRDLRFPCTKGLSVAGFFAFKALFLLGFGFILSLDYSLITRRFERFLTLLTVILSAVRTSSFLNIVTLMTDRRPWVGSVDNTEQYVHRRRGRRECSTPCSLHPREQGGDINHSSLPTHGSREETLNTALSHPEEQGGAINNNNPQPPRGAGRRLLTTVPPREQGGDY